MSALALRPLEFGEILDHAVELYRRNLATFLGIYAVAAVPCVAVSTPLMVKSLTLAPGGDPTQSLGLAVGGLVVFLLYTVFLSPITCGALTIAVSERFLGRPTGLVSAYRRVWRQAGPLIACLGLLSLPLLGALLGTMVAVVLAAMALLSFVGGGDSAARLTVVATALWVPAMSVVLLAFTTLFGFVPAAVVLEERRYGSIWRSLELVWGRTRRVFALFAVLFLMVILLAAYVRLPSQLLAGAAGLSGQASSAVMGALAMQLGILLVDPVRLVGITLTYYDLRIRHEGFDLALLADELGAATARDGKP